MHKCNASPDIRSLGRNYLMKSLLLVLTLSISIVAMSQQSQLEAFTNYGSCYQGLKYPKGKIVWEADFESLEKIHDYEHKAYPPRYYWIAEKNGSFGFINPDGEQVLPFRFNRIQSAYPLRKSIIASDDFGAYLYSNSGEMELKLEGYSWFEITANGYIVEKDGKFGLLDPLLKQILPTEYDKLDFEIVQHEGEATPRVLSNRFIRIEQDHQTAIYDLNQNTWVVPKTSEFIDPYWAASCSQSDAVFADPYWTFPCSESDAVFHLTNDTNQSFRIIGSNGKEVYSGPSSTDAEIILTPLDSCGMKSHQLMYIATDESMEVVSLKTGKRSKTYPWIHPLDGYSLFFTEKKWGVLDPDLNLVNQFNSPKSSQTFVMRDEHSKRQQALFQFYNYFDLDYHEYFSRNQQLTDSVLVLYQTNKSTRQNQYDGFLGNNYGLFNFHSGKKIKPAYHGLSIYEFNGKTIYWASNVKLPIREESIHIIEQLDIYNVDLQKIKSFSGSIYFERIHQKSNGQHLTIHVNGKWGVINPLGEAVIPIEYEECYRKEIGTIENVQKTDILFFTSKDRTIHNVFDFNGNVLIPKNYLRYEVKGQLLIASREDHLKDIYDSKGNLLLEGFKYQRDSPRIDEYGKCIGFEDQERFRVANCTYFTKDDQVYEFRDGKMRLLDENFFRFTENYCFLLEWIVIDKTGKNVTTQSSALPRLSDKYRNENPTACSTYFDEYPIPEPPKKERKPYIPPQRSHTPDPKTYSWKQHDRSKPDEWFLYNPNDVLMYEEPFEYPLPVNVFYGGVFMQNGKYGYFDSKYNQYLPAEYDYIYPASPFTFKNGKWQIHHRNSGKVSPEFDDISIDFRGSVHFVYSDGKIGVINDSMEFIIPLVDSADLVNNYDLVKLLHLRGIGRQTKTHIYNNLVFNGQPSAVYRTINNIQILEQVTLKSTKNNLLEFSPIDLNRIDIPSGFRDKKFYFHDNQTNRERIPMHANRYYYSEITYTWNQNIHYNGFSYYTHYHYKFKEFFNYKIVGNKRVLIQFSDLFKSDQTSVDKLNKLLLEKLTSIQAFGENCADIDQKVEELKQKFTIENGKAIVLHWQNVGGFTITLNFSEIEHLLLEPKKFMEI